MSTVAPRTLAARPPATPGTGPHVVVIGAGIGGLLSAAVLARHTGRITLVERDRLPDDARPRPGTPQATHPHGLLASGRDALEALFPGITTELISQGGHGSGDMGSTGRWYLGGGLLADCHLGCRGIAVSRPALEAAVRRRVRGLPQVEIRDQLVVTGLTGDRGRVSGLRVRRLRSVDPSDRPRTGADDVIDADLVIDSSGRQAHAMKWLAALDLPVPESEEIRINVWYSTMEVPHRTGDLDGRRVVVSAATPEIPRGGVAIQQETGTWKVTVFNYGDRPPVDPDGIRAFATTIVSPDLTTLIAERDCVERPHAFSMPSSRRRRFEALSHPPAGHLAIADAICSFNPVFGQGMSVAALQSLRLDAVIAEHGLTDPDLARHWYPEAAAVTDLAWTVVTGADLQLPGVTGSMTPAPAPIRRYVRRVQVAARRDTVAARAFMEVTNLLQPASSLMRPTIAWRALWHGGAHEPPPTARPRGLAERRMPATQR
ncbi:FAD-dependent oxidoreductase [Gordonia sp. NPDC003424]